MTDWLTIAIFAGVGYALAIAFILASIRLSGRSDDDDQQIIDQIAQGGAAIPSLHGNDL